MTNLHLRLKNWIKQSILICSLLTLISCGDGMSEQQMLQNARQYIDQGDLKAASLELKNTLQRNNKNAEARYLLAAINMRVGDYATAMKEFKRANDAGWDDEDTQVGIAQILLSQGRFKKLLDEITINKHWSLETRADVSALRAMAEAGLGHTALAKNTLKTAADYKTDALHVLKTTAMLKLSGLLDGDASNTIIKALSRYPNNIELLFLHASIDKKNKNLSRASDTYKKIISLDPPNITTPFSQKASIELARIEISQGNDAEASTILTRILAKNDNDLEANYLSALLAFTEKDYSRTENHLQKLLAIKPDHITSLQLMGKTRFALKQYGQAAQNFTEYLNIIPGDITIQKLLSQTYIYLNQPEKALTIVQPLLTHDPDDPITLRLQSQIELYRGNTQAGIRSLKKAIKTSPDDIALRKQLIKAFIANGETDFALNEINTFQTLSQNTEEAQKLSIAVYIRAGDTDKAINIARKILENNPKNPDLLALNGKLYATKNKNKLAQEYYTQALQVQDKHLSATLGLARLEIKNKNLDRAILLYKDLVNSNIGGVIPMLALSEIAAKQNRTDDILSWLEKARNTAPTDIKSRIILANYYLHNKQLNNANIYLQEALKISPEHADTLTLQGKLLIAQRRYNEAIAPLKKLAAKQTDPTNAHVLLGEAYLRQSKINDALANLRVAVKAQPKNYLAISLLSSAELTSGNYDNSFTHAKKLQQEQPQHHIGYLHEGDVWMAKKNYNKAQLAYSSAWRKQHSADLAIRFFSAATHVKPFDETIKPILTWLKENPDDKATRLFLATKYQAVTRNKLAIQEYEKVITQEPNDGATLNNLAWLYHLSNDPKALDLAERAYRSAPENASIQDTYGWILVQQNQATKGKRFILQAMAILPDNADIRYHYAVALLNSGSLDEGREMLESLLRQNKPFASRNEAKKLLNTL